MSANVSKASPSTLTAIQSLETRAWIAKLLIGAAIGATIGAIFGGLFFSALRTQQTATAFIRLTMPIDLGAVAGGAGQVTPDTSEGPEKYVAGEVAYLSGEGFAQTIGKKLGKPEPAVFKVAQESRSAIVTIGSSAPTADEAVRTVQAALDVYGQQLAQRADQHLQIVLPTLDQWQQANASNPQRIGDIQRLRESVLIQAAQASTVEVVQPPTLDDTSNLRWVIGLMLGACGGSSSVALVLFARRRRTGRGSLVMTMSDAVDGVLVPEVDLGSPFGRPWDEEQSALARTLYAQCPSPALRRVIVVLGVSEASGSGVVSSLLGHAAAGHGTVVLASATDDALPAPAEPDKRSTLIVDAGGLGKGKLTPEALRLATDIVVVARVDADTGMPAVAACSAAAAAEAPVMAAFTHRTWKLTQWAKRQRQPESDSGSDTGGRHSGGHSGAETSADDGDSTESG